MGKNTSIRIAERMESCPGIVVFEERKREEIYWNKKEKRKVG
jgi:hypothetical protein